MRFVFVAALASFLASALSAQQGDATSKLNGRWQADEPSGRETWVIAVHANSVHITHSRAGATLADFECSTMGRECEVEESGSKAKMSLWFNGPTLVELETKGADVLKRRFTPAADGGTLQVQILPVSPEGKTETLSLKRVPTSGAAS